MKVRLPIVEIEMAGANFTAYRFGKEFSATCVCEDEVTWERCVHGVFAPYEDESRSDPCNSAA